MSQTDPAPGTPASQEGTAPPVSPAASSPTYGMPQQSAPVYAYPAYPGYGYPQYPGTAMPGYTPYYVMPPRAPRDNYRLTVGIICTVLLGLTLLGGLLFALVLAISASTRVADSLGTIALLVFLTVATLAGGGVGLYFTIRALIGRPSAPLRLPSFVVPLALTVIVLAVGIAQYSLGIPQAPAFLETPLLLLSGILPAITIFTFAAERLRFPTTWRRVWMSYLSGTFLAALLAIIFETIASVVLNSILHADTGTLNVNSNNSSQLIGVFIITAVVAPLVEEGFKPIGPFIVLWRLSGPAEAFLVGMAAGIGFAIFETVGYIGSGAADWIVIAVLRIGAGLLHSVGAGMATLGWYYLLRGKGVAGRFAKGFGCLSYAVLQHALFNGSTFLSLATGPIGKLLNSPVWFFGLPMDGSFILAVVFYVAIASVLVTVTNNLRKGLPTAPAPVEAENLVAPSAAQPWPVMGGVR